MTDSPATRKFRDCILDPEREDAARRMADTAYWGDTGHWVLRAVTEVGLAIDRVPHGRWTPVADWLAAVETEIEKARETFRREEDDPDGYGSATFNGCLERVRIFRESLDEPDA